MQVEAALSISPYVDNIMLHANPFHSYCVAIVVAAQAAVEGWAKKHGIDFGDFPELCQNEETVKEVYASLVKVLSCMQIYRASFFFLFFFFLLFPFV